MLWTVVDIFLSWVVIFSMTTLVIGGFRWFLHPEERGHKLMLTLGNVACGALAALFVRHPRVVLVLAFAAMLIPYGYWYRRRRFTAKQERRVNTAEERKSE